MRIKTVLQVNQKRVGLADPPANQKGVDNVCYQRSKPDARPDLGIVIVQPTTFQFSPDE